jgi:hypothetical protein
VDPWGNPYVYEVTGRMSLEIRSFGPDGKEGTEDDLRRSM